MSKILKGITPERVMYYFEKICNIPHGSYHVEALSDYCVEFAKAHHLNVEQDEAFNVIIEKPAAAGMEGAPGVILQGHLDMVCEKNADVSFDFEHESLKLKVEGDYIFAEGTTLGADDGIAVAMALAILEDPTLPHPPLQVILTSEEETGMDGALFMDATKLKGKYFLNLDSEEEQVILCGCAGGLKATASFRIEPMTFEGVNYELSITGLFGGHSGTEIDKERANANKLLGRLLFTLRQDIPMGIVSINGGMKDNAIPREAFASLLIQEENISTAQAIVERLTEDLQNEYRISDPGLKVTFKTTANTGKEAFSFGCAEKLIYMLVNTPNGVQSMSASLNHLVECSLNLGVITTTPTHVNFVWSVRSSIRSKRDYINDRLAYMTELMGGEYYVRGMYPEWEYQEYSPLRDLAVTTYEQLYDIKPETTIVHAGLECGIFAEKLPGIDMISIGPNIFDIHTPAEHLSISSTERTWRYVLELLNRLGQNSQR